MTQVNATGAPLWLVTGGTGQLARALAAAAPAPGLAPAQLRVAGRPGFDFDRPETIDALFAGPPPALVINTAAWTAVDAAEAEPEAARRANAEGPARLAALCRRNGTALIHVSTDYVFDGAKGAPYCETDSTNPTGVYGRTKLEGETAVMAALPDAVILRTAWVYAEAGKNFLRTMLGAARRMDRLRVVADQRGCPTNADDLAHAILAVANTITQRGPGQSAGGIYHCAGAGETTWHGFAEAIFASAGPRGWPVPHIDAIATADWPTPAHRPADSRLDCSKLAATFGVTMPDWRPSLHRAVAAICAAETVA